MNRRQNGSSRFVQRVILEREVLTLVNRTLKKSPELAGLTEKTIHRWESACGVRCNYDVKNICSALVRISALLGSMSDNSRTVFESRGQGWVANEFEKSVEKLRTLLSEL